MTHKTPVNEGFAVTMEELRFPSACHSFSMHGSPHLNPICSGAAIKTDFESSGCYHSLTGVNTLPLQAYGAASYHIGKTVRGRHSDLLKD